MTTYYRAPAANGKGAKLQCYEKEVFLDVETIEPEKCIKYAMTFPFEDNDIMVCSPPKSGNHWMGNMVWKLKTLTDYKRPKFTVLELKEDDCYTIQEAPRIIQSHLRPTHLPTYHLEKNGKIVLMIRNPKDACVSFYHHVKNAKTYKNGQTFDEFFESYFNGQMVFPIIDYFKEWEDYLYGQRKNHAEDNIMVFYYEDCKKNPMANLKRLNTFLGFHRDDAYLQKVLELTGFEAMKSHEHLNKERIHSLCMDGEGASVIYRKGTIGDWKNHFTVAQSEKVDALIREKLTRNIIHFQY